MKRKSILFVSIGIVIILLDGVLLGGHWSANNKIDAVNNISKYSLHNPIKINGNKDFKNNSAVVGGNGTQDDPYIISGWDVKGIYIENTTAYFIIENCYIHDTQNSLVLHNVTNGMIKNNTIDGEYYGIKLESSDGNYIEKNTFELSIYVAIYLSSSNNNQIINNNCTHAIGDDAGISLYSSSYNIIMDNDCKSENEDIYLSSSDHNTMENNNCSGGIGVKLDSSSEYNTVKDNDFKNNKYYGVWIYSSSNNFISCNSFSNSPIELSGASHNKIDNNTFLNTKNNVFFLAGSDNNIIENNTISNNSGSGIFIQTGSDYNIIRYNLIYNSSYAVNIRSGSYNTIYKNSFYYNHGSGDVYNSSYIQAYDDGINNSWNTSKYGNFWYEWANNNNSNDQNNDGFVDWSYRIEGSANNYDEKPLKNPTYPKPPLAPTAPLNLKANAGVGYINLTWKKPLGEGSSPITGYKIYKNSTYLATVSSTVFWYKDTDVHGGINYSYYVTAVNSVGESRKSNVVHATPLSVPSPPQNLNASSGSGYVNLTWIAPANNGGTAIIKYNIYRNGTQIANVSSNQLWYNDTSVINGVQYNYYVTAINSVGESEPSNKINATPQYTYKIKFYIEPAHTGAIVLNGIMYLSGQMEYIKAGEYEIKANAWSGYKFDHWELSSNLSIENYTSYTTNVTINGNGTLTAVFTGSNYTEHSIIRINSNDDFLHKTQQEGWPGNGTKNNPYIISGYDIDTHGAGDAIYIGNTTVYFIVEHCYLHNASWHSWPYFYGNGIMLYNATNGKISGNNITKNEVGILLESSSSYNTISRNNITNSNRYGILLDSSSSYNMISENKITNSRYEGIDIVSSSSNLIRENRITSNSGNAIYLWDSTSNTISGNKMIGGSICLGWEDKATFTTQTIYTNNTVNGKPVYYYKSVNMNNASVPTDAGEVICGDVSWLKIEGLDLSGGSVGIDLGFSSHITIRGNNITNNNFDGIELASSSGNTISGNNITNNGYGIDLISSSSNTISGNSITNNNWNGIYLWNSNSNTIYNNLISNNIDFGIYINGGSYNLIYNNSFYYNYGSGDTYLSSHVQARDDGTNNYWNTTTGYGNYWHDWANNNDTNDVNPQDGIVDWPYKIDSWKGAVDHYPLKNPTYLSPPLAPRNLHVVAGNGYVNLTWQKPLGNGSSPIKEYCIYRNGTLIATVPATHLWYNDTNVTNGITYTYYVTAVNSVGESEKSNEVQATPNSAVPELLIFWLPVLALSIVASVWRKRKMNSGNKTRTS